MFEGCLLWATLLLLVVCFALCRMLLTAAVSCCATHTVRLRQGGCVSIADESLANVITDDWCNDNCMDPSLVRGASQDCVSSCSCSSSDSTSLSPSDEQLTVPLDPAAKLRDDEALKENRRFPAEQSYRNRAEPTLRQEQLYY